MIEAVAGFLAGLIAGTFGIGGGAVSIPFLIFMLGLPLPIAIGTDLVIVTINSLASLYFHLRQGTIAWKGTVMGLVGASATLLGHYLFLMSIKAHVLKLIVGISFILLSFTMWIKVDGNKEPGLKELIATGIIMGIDSALLGKGGGSIAIPVLVALFKVRTKEAIKASVAATPIVAMTAMAEKCLSGLCEPLIALKFAPFLILGSYAGTKLMRLSSSEALKIGYSLFLLITGLLILVS